MFNLPTFTAVALFGVGGFWVIYTLVFLWISRSWRKEDVEVTGED